MMTAEEIVARTLWGEARGEGVAGMRAVANVIMNRVAKPGWWGRDPAAVCQHPWQFSCWNPNDPNHEKLLSVGEGDPSFANALQVARQALAGELPDVTDGATHYKVTSLPWPHDWGAVVDPLVVIGHHSFYRIG